MSLNFGCLVPGNFPITGNAFRQVSQNQWMAPIGYAADAFSVFLISDSEPLPDNSGLGCYLCRCEDRDSWTYIGHLTNNRPSALLRSPTFFMELHRGVEVFLGISLQSLGELENIGKQNELAMQDQCRAARLDQMAEKIAEDFFNFAGSYSRTEMRTIPQASDGAQVNTEPVQEEVVVLPMNWVLRWKNYIQSKILKDPLLWLAKPSNC